MIITAVQRGSFVYVYNENNNQIACQSGTLVGFTGSSFSVKRGSFIYTYNERNSQISCHST